MSQALAVSGKTKESSAAHYYEMMSQAQDNPEAFWLEQAQRLTWKQVPTCASRSSFTGDIRVDWFPDGVMNASENCLDRHLKTQPDKQALIWEGQTAGQRVVLTYRELHARVCRLANTLRRLGVRKGECVAIHLPMVAEGVIAMLACARIGAVHVVLFGGFSAEGLAERLTDSGAVLVVTADLVRRGDKSVPSKEIIDHAIELCGKASVVRHILVVPVTGTAVPMQAGRDLCYAKMTGQELPECPAEPLAASDPLFLLYTSGSTGRPKGLLHCNGGYMVWAAFTYDVVFDHRPADIFWCTADISWITGHTYVVYGPLANGGTIMMYDGLPSWPEPGRWWEVIERNGVTGFYTSPTVVRAVMRESAEVVRRHPMKSLRVLGVVGEPIGHDAWEWFYDEVGKKRCAVIDTWWQTETGGIMIAAAAGAVKPRPGSAALPLPGVETVLLDSQSSQIIEGAGEGVLCLARSWPGQAVSIWKDHDRFKQAYFTTFPGYYFTGDGARRDDEGYYWITGRVDDVVNVSGHRISTAELEGVVSAEPTVADCAVVGIPHDIKGQALVVFVVPRKSIEGFDISVVSRAVAAGIGRYAVPDKVYVADDLPKTRSGKIVRRLLRKIAADDLDGLGDLSTLAEPGIVQVLIDVVHSQKAADKKNKA